MARKAAIGFICIWLAGAYLTPDPSPAGNIGRKPQLLLAGEGCMPERGRSPLSIITPPFKHTKKRGLKDNLFERGPGGENLKSTKTEWNLSYQGL